ncbi:LOW QUALITY PROTEIN: NADP-dependent oxidoreductase domain-containing protein 1 [Ciconia maguari]
MATSGLQVVNSARQDSNHLRWGMGSFLSLMSLAEGVSAQLVPLTPWESCLSWLWDITEPFKSSQTDEAVEREEASMHLTRCKGLAVNVCAHAIFFCKLLHDLRQSGTEKGLPTSLGDSHGLKIGIISGGHLGKQLAALLALSWAPCPSIRVSTRRPESLGECSPAWAWKWDCTYERRWAAAKVPLCHFGQAASGPSLGAVVCVSPACSRAQVTALTVPGGAGQSPVLVLWARVPFSLLIAADLQKQGLTCLYDSAQLVAWADVALLCCLPLHMLSICSIIWPAIQKPCVVYRLVTTILLLGLKQVLCYSAIVRPQCQRSGQEPVDGWGRRGQSQARCPCSSRGKIRVNVEWLVAIFCAALNSRTWQSLPHQKALKLLSDLCFHRITESHRLEKTFKIIESNRKPNTNKTTASPWLPESCFILV